MPLHKLQLVSGSQWEGRNVAIAVCMFLLLRDSIGHCVVTHSFCGEACLKELHPMCYGFFLCLILTIRNVAIMTLTQCLLIVALRLRGPIQLLRIIFFHCKSRCLGLST